MARAFSQVRDVEYFRSFAIPPSQTNVTSLLCVVYCRYFCSCSAGAMYLFPLLVLGVMYPDFRVLVAFGIGIELQ